MKTSKILTLATVVSALAVAGCQTGMPDGGGQRAARQTGVEGQWMGTDGVAVSTLQGGRFSSRAVETGEVLTEGSYSHRGAQTIDLSFYSLKSQRQTSATCLLASSDRMNCTLANGTNFVLTRTSGVS
ncbi:hypothetical protein H7H48_07755 [Nitratireductor sp. B36]|jgi:hypothetical protein|uniref:hypothetical protein n=1 Tax=Nitratireductor sp. B36 TaxID=2762059 RepID=UPI001E5D80B0|nr:hypothetical protein [Nitratireductor sp. B36]MCC5778941.1 hypothetical protein [Nitratireductor sp. B36]